MCQTLSTDKKWGKIIFGPEVEWTTFRETAAKWFIKMYAYPVRRDCVKWAALCDTLGRWEFERPVLQGIVWNLK